MKKQIFLALTLIAVSVVSYSQAKISLGVKAGLNLSSISTKATPGETYKSSTGYHGGVFATVKIAKIGIQPEILFSKQGYVTNSAANGKETFDYKYVNIPVMVKWYLVKGLNIQVGPQFGLLTSAALEAADGTTTDQKNALHNSLWSLCAGVGFDLPLKLNVDARYVIGLSDVNTTAAGAEAIKSRVVQLSLGYRFLNKGN